MDPLRTLDRCMVLALEIVCFFSFTFLKAPPGDQAVRIDSIEFEIAGLLARTPNTYPRDCPFKILAGRIFPDEQRTAAPAHVARHKLFGSVINNGRYQRVIRANFLPRASYSLDAFLHIIVIS